MATELTDTGTRWQHLADVREIRANALANLERIKQGYLSVGDKKLIEKLSAGIELIDKQIDLMSRYDIKRSTLIREIDAIPPAPKEENADQDGAE
jgi:hypothetical protein